MRRGDRGRRVDGHAQRGRGHPVLPAASVAVAVRLWPPFGQRPPWCSSRPLFRSPARCRAASHRQDLDRAVGFRRAGQRQRIVIGDAVADDAAVGRERGDASGATGAVVSMVTLSAARGRAGIAGSISCRGGQAVAAIRQHRRGVAPGPCSARQRAAQQRRAVEDLDRAVGFRRAGQRQRIVIGDAVADDAAVGRERGDLGAIGAVVSMVTFSALEATPVLPAASVAVAVRLWPPFGRPPWCSSRPLFRSPARCRAASRRRRP